MYSCRYTTDTIASIAFGFNCNSLKYPDHDFRRYGNMVNDINPIKNALTLFAPFIMDWFNISFTPKPVENFFSTTFSDMVNYRRSENVRRNDFLSMLIQLMDNGQISDDKEKSQSKNGKNAGKYFVASLEFSTCVEYC